ncbi:unnamed protein product [Microthlaspi erraticum]|uniref:Uncharacterized protein n=1 Tax=Microthlaspi erraticum TaxID=1685480 RepID=A0A6D2KQJ9_9BRAS|nr:unnamed protein product [Microthlaspi erraticum]
MDFIKTSSLRALIELTFQRNWNGLIWMSRKGVIAKRVKTVQQLIENQRPNRAEAGRGTNVPRSAKTIRPSEVSAKVQTIRPITHHDPGNIVPRSATPQRSRHTAHDRRASREQRLAAAQPHSRTTADVRPSRGTTPASGRETIGHSTSVRPHGRPNHPATTVPHATTRLSGRSSRPTVRTPRSTRSRF